MFFVSPQALTEKKHWKDFFVALLKKKMLKLIVIDEIQLFVSYGLSFRTEFASLSSTLFSHVKKSNSTCQTTIPILFMTATCTTLMVEQLQTLTGLKLGTNYDNVYWPNSMDMMNTRVKLNIVYSIHPLSLFQSIVLPILKEHKDRCFIFYGNSKDLINHTSEKYGNWLDY